mmetsp:Transcript_15485/g.54269  ORF Transcript_15485/g.54269 Transcript_15485/m.54269 type:complete len:277 (+) Transcript_15485:311-1141(+)
MAGSPTGQRQDRDLVGVEAIGDHPLHPVDGLGDRCPRDASVDYAVEAHLGGVDVELLRPGEPHSRRLDVSFACASMQESVHADDVRCKALFEHVLHPPLSTTQVADLGRGENHGAVADHVRLAAGLLHALEPLLCLAQGTTLAARMDEAVVHLLVWLELTGDHVVQPELGLDQVAALSTDADQRVVRHDIQCDPCRVHPQGPELSLHRVAALRVGVDQGSVGDVAWLKSVPHHLVEPILRPVAVLRLSASADHDVVRHSGGLATLRHGVPPLLDQR